MITVVKGIVTAVEQNSLLGHTCYSAEFEHEPSKHTDVTYRLRPENDGTHLSISQGDFSDEETYKANDASWDKVLEGLRMMLEERPRKDLSFSHPTTRGLIIVS